MSARLFGAVALAILLAACGGPGAAVNPGLRSVDTTAVYCIRRGMQCGRGVPCCPGLKCIPAQQRAYCEPSRLLSAYVRASGTRKDTLVVIDMANHKAVKAIPVGSDASSVAITPDGKKLYVLDPIRRSISVIDTHSNRIAKTVTLGFSTHPADVTVAASGLDTYVSDTGGAVSFIDASDDALTATVPAGVLAIGIATPYRCNSRAAASNDGSTIYMLNTNEQEMADAAELRPLEI